ncbi:histidine phosphatase family protein [Roseateles sp.]|uniref:histidine phosphatase family protein n=1 Tax=Roseateles sp. TaxID=1971397 RepID=UPI0039199274
MPSNTSPSAPDRRRLLRLALATGLPGLLAPAAAAEPEALALLRRGGVVLALRHALAPGTLDPPGFRLGDCSTQRNLSEQGRAQARARGQRLRAAGRSPARVRSSPGRRGRDTAELAFGRAEAWSALASPHGASEQTQASALAELRQALAAAVQQPGRFEVWVTHMFVLSDLLGVNTASGEGLVLGWDAATGPRVLARWQG